MLTRSGFEVTSVEDGKEAVAIYTSYPDSFDLILMDIQMPKMNGLDATMEIREWETKAGPVNSTHLLRHIPIIAMTAQGLKGDREKCLEAGMDDYIAKPIKKDEVLRVVKQWSESKAAAFFSSLITHRSSFITCLLNQAHSQFDGLFIKWNKCMVACGESLFQCQH